jgi:hypothetical protein
MAEGPNHAPAGVVAVAASAGGVEALSVFARSLPADFPGAVLVVLHLPESGPSVLPSILGRSSALRVVSAATENQLEAGLVMVAPPGQHLRVHDQHVVLDRGPKEKGHRPSADALFRSVAETYGPRAAGVVLSGTMDDGAVGLRMIGECGGFTIAQDPSEAAFPGMPSAAIAEATPEGVCRAGAIGRELATWIGPHVISPAGAAGGDGRGSKVGQDELSAFPARSLLTGKEGATEASPGSGDGGRCRGRIDLLRSAIDELARERTRARDDRAPVGDTRVSGSQPTV